MDSSSQSNTVSSLARLLGQLRTLYERLLELIQQKMDAMRRADLHALRAISEEEAPLVYRLQEREGLRRQLMGLIARAHGLSDGDGRSATISQIAERIDGTQRRELGSAADALREVVAKVAGANRIAGAATRDVLHHMQWVTASIRPGGRRPEGYSPKGAKVDANGAMLFETLG
jgi:hypothetical protein